MNSHSLAHFNQSAVIPYRICRGQLEIVLITERQSRKWIIPKGVIEPYMTPPQSAAKEALEEGGIQGRVSEELLGVYTYPKWGGTCNVQVFALQVENLLGDWLEARFRKRQWFALPAAIAALSEPALQQILRRFSQQVLGPSSLESNSI